MTASIRSAWAVLAVVTAMALAAPRTRSDEPAGRLAPIPATAAKERVDPVRPSRLSATERDRLYAQAARDAEHLERQALQLRRLVQLARPTVVHIDATKPLQRPRNGKATEEEAGSGVLTRVAGKTVVLTNRHVIHRAELDAIVIRLDDARELRPKRLWSDQGTDIAVLEVEGEDLDEARLAAGSGTRRTRQARPRAACGRTTLRRRPRRATAARA